MPVASGTVTLNADKPALVCRMGENGCLLSVTADCYIGGPDVAAAGEKRGVLVSPGVPVWMPGVRAWPSPVMGQDTYLTPDLYAIAGSGSPEISYVVPLIPGTMG